MNDVKQNKDWMRTVNVGVIMLCIGQGVVFFKWTATELHSQDKRLATAERWIDGHKELVANEKKLLDFEITEKLRAKADAQYNLLLQEIGQLKKDIMDLKIAIRNGTATSN